MKKWMAFCFVWVCLLGLIGCANKEKVWDWSQSLTQGDILSVTPWHRDGEYIEYEPLSDEEVLELVTLLNNLTKKSFTQNKKGVGITATVGMRIEFSAGSCNLNYAPSPYGKYGMLEIGFLEDDEMPYWIDNAGLLAFFERVTNSETAG